MPLFYRVKDPDTGRISMVAQDLLEPDTTPTVAPLTPSIATVGVKRYTCTACQPPRPFASPGIAAMHFKKAHSDQYVDKLSWRKWVKEFGDL